MALLDRAVPLGGYFGDLCKVWPACDGLDDFMNYFFRAAAFHLSAPRAVVEIFHAEGVTLTVHRHLMRGCPCAVWIVAVSDVVCWCE